MRAQEGNPPGEGYLAQVARPNALRKQAEEIVLADLILLPPNPVPARMARSHRHSRCAGRPVTYRDTCSCFRHPVAWQHGVQPADLIPLG